MRSKDLIAVALLSLTACSIQPRSELEESESAAVAGVAPGDIPVSNKTWKEWPYARRVGLMTGICYGAAMTRIAVETGSVGWGVMMADRLAEQIFNANNRNVAFPALPQHIICQDGSTEPITSSRGLACLAIALQRKSNALGALRTIAEVKKSRYWLTPAKLRAKLKPTPQLVYVWGPNPKNGKFAIHEISVRMVGGVILVADPAAPDGNSTWGASFDAKGKLVYTYFNSRGQPRTTAWSFMMQRDFAKFMMMPKGSAAAPLAGAMALASLFDPNEDTFDPDTTEACGDPCPDGEPLSLVDPYDYDEDEDEYAPVSVPPLVTIPPSTPSPTLDAGWVSPTPIDAGAPLWMPDAGAL